MKKVLFIMLIAVLLVALAAPVFADKKATPNGFGQAHKNIEDLGWEKVSDAVHELKDGLTEDENWGQYIKDELKPMFTG